jgi:uncharacterized protein (UPF0264 family)
MMANIYIYRISGLEPLDVVRIVANNKKHAEYKLDTLFVDGRKLEKYEFIKEEKFDNKIVV